MSETPEPREPDVADFISPEDIDPNDPVGVEDNLIDLDDPDVQVVSGKPVAFASDLLDDDSDQVPSGIEEEIGQ